MGNGCARGLPRSSTDGHAIFSVLIVDDVRHAVVIYERSRHVYRNSRCFLFRYRAEDRPARASRWVTVAHVGCPEAPPTVTAKAVQPESLKAQSVTEQEPCLWAIFSVLIVDDVRHAVVIYERSRHVYRNSRVAHVGCPEAPPTVTAKAVQPESLKAQSVTEQETSVIPCR
jgi:hypothetical protein